MTVGASISGIEDKDVDGCDTRCYRSSGREEARVDLSAGDGGGVEV